jgi:anti-sigma-K factor RskA
LSSQLTHEHFQELLGAHALHALEPYEVAELEQHLEGCPSCRIELAEHREALAALSPSLPAPANSWEGIQAVIDASREDSASDPRNAEAVEPTPIRRGRASRWVGVAAGTAAAVAAAVVLTVIVTGDDLGTPAVEAQIVPAETGTTISGQAQLFDPDSLGGVLILELADIPASPDGHHYQVWVLRSDGAGAMEAVGAFSPEAGAARLELPLPGPGEYAAVDISVQEDGGPPEHSGVSIAGASLS